MRLRRLRHKAAAVTVDDQRLAGRYPRLAILVHAAVEHLALHTPTGLLLLHWRMQSPNAYDRIKIVTLLKLDGKSSMQLLWQLRLDTVPLSIAVSSDGQRFACQQYNQTELCVYSLPPEPLRVSAGFKTIIEFLRKSLRERVVAALYKEGYTSRLPLDVLYRIGYYMVVDYMREHGLLLKQ